MGAKRQIAFDIDTNELKNQYRKSDWHNAYYDIKKSMIENGFKHQQGSVYVSEEQMEIYEVHYTIKKIIADNPWLPLCTRDMTVTDIGKEYSLNYIMKQYCNNITIEEEKFKEVLFKPKDNSEFEF